MTAQPDLDLVTATLFAHAEKGQWDSFRSMFTADAVLAQNVGKPASIDKALPGLRSFTDGGMTLRYDNVRRFVGTAHVTEIHDAVFTRADGAEVRLDICVVLHFNADGLVERADEYLDSAAAAALFEG